MIIYRAIVTKGDEILATFYDYDLTKADEAARSVVQSGNVVTISTVVEAIDGEWEDTDDDNVVMRYRIATPDDINY